MTFEYRDHDGPHTNQPAAEQPAVAQAAPGNARGELLSVFAGRRLGKRHAVHLLDAYRAEVLREAADAVAKHTDNPIDTNAKMLHRMADETAP